MLTPLIMYFPPVPDGLTNKWQQFVQERGVEICSIGQLRSDKNLPMLVEACARSSRGLLIAGKDAGAISEIRAAISEFEGRAFIIDDYLPLEDLAAIITVVRTVALPYSVASQSAVAELAHAYGAVTVGPAVGGLAEQLDVVVDSLEVADWAAALSALPARQSLIGATSSPKPPSAATVESILRVFRTAS